ncbi:hypothetical protein YERSI8AC_180030 [Enterobacterales bacterium 8AC]|nr:hypothetical protein YERSI8AC_180030 [Enterobacterales bacterium 8AC]
MPHVMIFLPFITLYCDIFLLQQENPQH